MKKKTSKNTSEAMEIILSRMGLPKAVYCDEGTEFTSHEFKKLMEKNKIRLIFTLTHAPVVERFNRTLKEMLNKYLIVSKSKTITNILPKILENYNNSYHSSIGMSPNNVNKNNEHIVWKNLFRKAKKMTIRSLTIGDHVRVMLKEKSNIKKHKPRYSKTVHTITDIKDGLVSVNNNEDHKLKPTKVILTSPIWSNIINRIKTFDEKYTRETKSEIKLKEFILGFRKKITDNKSVNSIKYLSAFIFHNPCF